MSHRAKEFGMAIFYSPQAVILTNVITDFTYIAMAINMNNCPNVLVNVMKN